GVVDQQIDVPMPLEHACDQLLDGCSIADVRDDRLAGRRGLPALARDVLQHVGAARGGHHGRTPRSKVERDRAPDAARRTGDDRNAVLVVVTHSLAPTWPDVPSPVTS